RPTAPARRTVAALAGRAPAATRRTLAPAPGSPPPLLPRHRPAGAGPLRQAQHPLRDDGAHDLRRGTLDRVALGPQRAAPHPAPPPVRVVRLRQLPGVVPQRFVPTRVELQPAELLPQPGRAQLGGAALRAGVP